MFFQVSCESCGKSLKARTEFVGKRVRCPKCGHRNVLQKPSGLLEETEDIGLAPIDEKEERELREKERAADREFEKDGTYGLGSQETGG